MFYALAYPALNMLAGHTYPASPTFGVPCPTGILTAGLLLTTAHRPPIPVVVVPVLWALIGGSAALVLGVATDYVLSGVLGAPDRRHRQEGPRSRLMTATESAVVSAPSAGPSAATARPPS